MLFLFIGIGVGQAHCLQHERLSKEEFNNKQREYIISEAELTPAEADLFFPVYFELQELKRKNQREIGKLMRKSRTQLSDKEYNDVLVKIYELKRENSELDLKYYYRFAELLPKDKIVKIIHSEIKFQRQIIRGMHQKNDAQAGKRARNK